MACYPALGGRSALAAVLFSRPPARATRPAHQARVARCVQALEASTYFHSSADSRTGLGEKRLSGDTDPALEITPTRALQDPPGILAPPAPSGVGSYPPRRRSPHLLTDPALMACRRTRSPLLPDDVDSALGNRTQAPYLAILQRHYATRRPRSSPDPAEPTRPRGQAPPRSRRGRHRALRSSRCRSR